MSMSLRNHHIFRGNILFFLILIRISQHLIYFQKGITVSFDNLGTILVTHFHFNDTKS